MKYGNRPIGGGFSRGHNIMLPPGIKALLIANGVVFLFQVVWQSFPWSYFALRPLDVLTRGFIWQLGTYMFLHGDFWHIFFNMFVLWMFGRSLEDIWGTRAFLKYYFITGIAAAIITVPFYVGNAVVGASGAVLAILFAYARTWPNNRIYIYFLFPVPAKYFVGFLILIDLLAMAGQPGSGNVAHITHLGGVLVGWLYLRKVEGRLIRFSLSDWWRRRRQKKLKSRLTKKREADVDFMAEVDRVLDRINEVGYEGLTDKEKQILSKASARLSEPD